MKDAAKNFDISTTCLSVLRNYFDDLTKLFLTKSFFPRIRDVYKNLSPIFQKRFKIMKKLFLKTIIFDHFDLRSYSFKMIGGVPFRDAPRESQLKIFK